MNRADLIDWTLHRALAALPSAACSEIGALLAPTMGKRPHPVQHANVLRVFARLRPDWATQPGGVEAAADRLWANIGRTFAEFSVNQRILRTGRVTIEGRERLDAAFASGRPLIGLFPHLGSWELSEMQMGFVAPGKVAVVVAPPASKARAAISQKVREQSPLQMFPTSRTVWRQTVNWLKTPGNMMMLAVDEAVNGRTMGPAFDGVPDPAGNLAKAARLALKSRALIVPFHNERLRYARFITHVLPPFELEGEADDEGAIQAALLRMDRALQQPILRLLDQWYMALNAPI